MDSYHVKQFENEVLPHLASLREATTIVLSFTKILRVNSMVLELERVYSHWELLAELNSLLCDDLFTLAFCVICMLEVSDDGALVFLHFLVKNLLIVIYKVFHDAPQSWSVYLSCHCLYIIRYHWRNTFKLV